MLRTRSRIGEKTTWRVDILNEATRFYKCLYSSTIQQQQNGVKPQAQENIPKILKSEVRNAISELKKGKTPGEDGIRNEFLIYESEILVKPIIVLLY